jgi:tetratricopeptide (TPR) repeat protein
VKVKILFFIFFLSTHLFSFKLLLNYFKDNGQTYEVLHIKYEKEFECKETRTHKATTYRCIIPQNTITKFENKKSKYFDIKFSKFEDKKFVVTIHTTFNVKHLGINDQLFKTKTISNFKITPSKHHFFLASQVNVDYFGKDTKQDHINFPIYYPKNIHPHISSLDLNNEPIEYATNTKDIKDYISVKQNFELKKYKQVVANVDKLLQRFPDTMFRNELILYKLRAYMHLLKDKNYKRIVDHSQLLNIAKKWIKDFPSNENITEMLYYIAKLYNYIGGKNDANYFIDILKTEYENDRYTQYSIILRGDMLYASQKKKEGLQIYKQVLYSTKYIDVASLAAMKLALNSIAKGDTINAKKYFEKILNANEEFLLKNKEEALKIAYDLAQNKLYNLATKIGEKLVRKMSKRDPAFEVLLKDIAIWHEKTPNVNQAYKAYKTYLEKFPYGEYTDLVAKNIDTLLFDIEETNTTKRLKHFKNLQTKYEDQKIINRAIYETIKLLYETKQYKKALTQKQKVENIVGEYETKSLELLQKSAKKQVLLSIQSSCEDLQIALDYNITLDAKYDKNLYNCYEKYALLDKAKVLTDSHLEDKNLQNRIFWLEKKALLLYKNNQLGLSLLSINDTLELANFLDTKDYNHLLYTKASILFKQNKYNDLIQTTQQIEKQFPNKFKNAQNYYNISTLAAKNNDDLAVETYANKLITMQENAKSFIYSPKVEMTLINALKNLDKKQKALNITTKTLTLPTLKPKNKIRLLYLAGELTLKLNQPKKAKKFFEKCTSVDGKSPWLELCTEQLKIAQ